MKTFSNSLILVSLLFMWMGSYAQTDTTQIADTSNRIREVERNLVGTTMTEGDGPYTIRDRMAHYRVKGLSIAVIHNYKMEWAKGYGFADEDLKTPVTDQTLFQAASISKSLNAVGCLSWRRKKR